MNLLQKSCAHFTGSFSGACLRIYSLKGDPTEWGPTRFTGSGQHVPGTLSRQQNKKWASRRKVSSVGFAAHAMGTGPTAVPSFAAPTKVAHTEPTSWAAGFDERYEIHFATEKKPPFFELKGSEQPMKWAPGVTSPPGPADSWLKESDRKGKDFRLISESLGARPTGPAKRLFAKQSVPPAANEMSNEIGYTPPSGEDIVSSETDPLQSLSPFGDGSNSSSAPNSHQDPNSWGHGSIASSQEAASLGRWLPSNPRKLWNDQFESVATSAHLKSLKYSRPVSQEQPTKWAQGQQSSEPINQRRTLPVVHHQQPTSSAAAAHEVGSDDQNFLFPHDDLKSSLMLRAFEMYPKERHFIGKTDNFSLKIASSGQIERVGTREKMETREGRSVLVRYGEVENSETVSYKDFKNPHPGGLYCSRIFGPIKNWVCTNPGCSDTKKGLGAAAVPVSRKGNDEFLGAPDGRGKYREFKCSVCGNGLYPSTLRRYRMGYIHLYQPLVHVSYIHSRQNLFAHLLRWNTKEIHSLIYNNLNLINFGHTELFSACFAPLFGFCEDSLGEALEWLRGDYFSLCDQATVVLRLLQPGETRTADRISKAQTQIPDMIPGGTNGVGSISWAASSGQVGLKRESEWQLDHEMGSAQEKIGWTKKWPLEPDPVLLSTAWKNSQNFPKKIESLFCPEIATVDTLLIEDQNFFIDILTEWKEIFAVPKQGDLTLFQKFQVEIFERDPNAFEEPQLQINPSAFLLRDPFHGPLLPTSWAAGEEFFTLFASQSGAQMEPTLSSTGPLAETSAVGSFATCSNFVGSGVHFMGCSPGEGIQAVKLSKALNFPDLEIFYEKTFGTFESFLKDPKTMYSKKFTKNSFFVLQDFLTKFQAQFFKKKSDPLEPTRSMAGPLADPILEWNQYPTKWGTRFTGSSPRKFHSARGVLNFMCFRKNATRKAFLRASGFRTSPIWSPASQTNSLVASGSIQGAATRETGTATRFTGTGELIELSKRTHRLENARRQLQEVCSSAEVNTPSALSWEHQMRVAPKHFFSLHRSFCQENATKWARKITRRSGPISLAAVSQQPTEALKRVAPNRLAKLTLGSLSHLKANSFHFFGSKSQLAALAQRFHAKKGFRIQQHSEKLPHFVPQFVGGFPNFERRKENFCQKLLKFSGQLRGPISLAARDRMAPMAVAGTNKVGSTKKRNKTSAANKVGTANKVGKRQKNNVAGANRHLRRAAGLELSPFQSVLRISESRQMLAKPYFLISGIAQRVTRPKKQTARSGLGFSLPLSHPAFAQNFVTSFDLSSSKKVKSLLENQVKKPSKRGNRFTGSSLSKDFLPPGNPWNSLKLFERSRIFDRNDVIEEGKYFLGPRNGFFEKKISLQFLTQENEFHNLLAFFEASPFYLKEQNRFLKRVHSALFHPFVRMIISRLAAKSARRSRRKNGAKGPISVAAVSSLNDVGGTGTLAAREEQQSAAQDSTSPQSGPDGKAQNSWNFSPRGTIREGDLLYGWLPSEHMMQRLIKLLGNASLGTNSPEVMLSQKPFEIFTFKKNKALVYGWTFQKLLKGQALSPVQKKAKTYFALKGPNALRGKQPGTSRAAANKIGLDSRRNADGFDSNNLEKEGTRFALSSFHRQLQNLLFQKQTRNGFQNYHCEDGATILTIQDNSARSGHHPHHPKKSSGSSPRSGPFHGPLLGEESSSLPGSFVEEPEYDLNYLFDLKSPDDFGPWKRWPEFAKFFLYNGGPTLKKYFRSENWPQTALRLRKRIRRADPSVVLTKKISKLFEVPKYMGNSPEKWKSFLFSQVNRTKPGLVKETFNTYFRAQRASLLAEEKRLLKEIRVEEKSKGARIEFWSTYDITEPKRRIRFEEDRAKAFRTYKKEYRTRQKTIQRFRAQQVKALQRLELQQRKEKEKQQRALERAQLKLQKEKEKEQKQKERIAAKAAAAALKRKQPTVSKAGLQLASSEGEPAAHEVGSSFGADPTSLPTPLGAANEVGSPLGAVSGPKEPTAANESTAVNEVGSLAAVESLEASNEMSSSPLLALPPEEKFFETDEELFEYFINFEYPPYQKKTRRNTLKRGQYAALFEPTHVDVENSEKVALSKAKRKKLRANLVYMDSLNVEKVFQGFPFPPEEVGWSTDMTVEFSNTLTNPLWRNFLIHEMFKRNSLRDQEKPVKKDLVWDDFVTYQSSPLDISSLKQNPTTSATPRGCLSRMNALLDFDRQIKRYDLTTRKADKKKADQYYQRFQEYLKALQDPIKMAREEVGDPLQMNPQIPFKKRTRKMNEKKRLVKQYRAVLTLLKNPSCIERGVFDKFPILPPDLRPILQLGDVKAVSDMTSLYILLIQRNIRHGKILFESYGESNEFLIDSKTMVQVAADNALDKCREKNVNNLIVGRMLDYKDSSTQIEQWASAKPKTKGPGSVGTTLAPRTLYDRLSGKEGRFRMNLLGKRVDYSGRSVIIVGPSLNVDQCGVPYEMALELFQPFVLRYMLEDPEKKVQKYLHYDPWIPDDTLLDHLKLSAQLTEASANLVASTANLAAGSESPGTGSAAQKMGTGKSQKQQQTTKLAAKSAPKAANKLDAPTGGSEAASHSELAGAVSTEPTVSAPAGSGVLLPSESAEHPTKSGEEAASLQQPAKLATVTGPLATAAHEVGLDDEPAEVDEPTAAVNLQPIRPIKSLSQAKLILRKKKALGRMILRQIVPRFPVLLNRAPTLHRLGIQGFHPVLVYGRALHLHPLVCGSFNADFDGDQMAVHIPLSLKARFDIRMLMFAPVNWLSPATGQPTVVPSQDMVLGLFYMTLEKIALQKGRGAFFNTLSDAVQAYQTGMLEIQSQIWVKWNGPFANNKMNDESSEESYEDHSKQGKAAGLEMGHPLRQNNHDDFQIRRKPFFPNNQMKFWKRPLAGNEVGQEQMNAGSKAVKHIFSKKNLLRFRKAVKSTKEYQQQPMKLGNSGNSNSLAVSTKLAPFGTAGEMSVRARWWNDLVDTRLFSKAFNAQSRPTLLVPGSSAGPGGSAEAAHEVGSGAAKESWFEMSRRQKRRRESGPVKYGRQKGFFYHSFGRFSNDEDEPIEIRIHQTGNSRKIYPDFQWLDDSKEESSSRISYIRTTPGRALMNQLIYPAYE